MVPHCPWVHSPCPTVLSQPLGSRLCSVHHPSWCPSPRLSGDPTSREAFLSPPLHALCDPLQAPVRGTMQLHPWASRCHCRDKLSGPGLPTPLPPPSPTTLDLVTQRGRWWWEASPSVRVGEQWDHKSWYRNVLGLPEPRAGGVCDVEEGARVQADRSVHRSCWVALRNEVEAVSLGKGVVVIGPIT